MSDSTVLSSHLRRASLSADEIVLDFVDANEAVNYLMQHDMGISGWEGRIIRSDGSRGDAPEYSGSGGIYPAAGEPPVAFAKRSGLLCRRTIREQHDRWLLDPRSVHERLYFCVTLTQ